MWYVQHIAFDLNFLMVYNCLTLCQFVTLRSHIYVLVKLKSSGIQALCGFAPRFGRKILQGCILRHLKSSALIIKWKTWRKVKILFFYPQYSLVTLDLFQHVVNSAVHSK